jgi:hypothetical protein
MGKGTQGQGEVMTTYPSIEEQIRIARRSALIVEQDKRQKARIEAQSKEVEKLTDEQVADELRKSLEAK